MRTWNEKAFVGGHPILDFINTVDDVDKSRSVSRIANWGDFCGWAQGSSMFEDEQHRALEDLTQKVATDPLLEQIHRLRENQYQALIRILEGSDAQQPDLSELEERICQAMRRSSLHAGETGYRWQPDLSHADWVSDLLLLSFERLLRSAEISKLRQCGRCSWLFLNTGRGKGRRWCDMSTCGNRAKLESFRSRGQ